MAPDPRDPARSHIGASAGGTLGTADTGSDATAGTGHVGESVHAEKSAHTGVNHIGPGMRSHGSGTDLGPALGQSLDRIARVPHLLVGLDFDGTLAPFRVDPSASRATPEAAAAVRRLVQLPDTVVALVSGRALDSLAEVAEAPEGTVLVGSHGLETRLGDGTTVPIELDDTQRAALVELDQRLSTLAAGAPGAWVECKPSSVSLHTRAMEDAALAESLEKRARAAAEDLSIVGDRATGAPRVDVLGGKRVVELAVLRGDKGRALSRLRAQVRADAVFYAGDDTTDERAFRSLVPGDVGVHVGDGPTAAAHSVPGIEAVPTVLERLAGARERTRPTSP